jgi:hypothetical protein
MTDNTPEGLPPLADLSEALARGREPRKLWPARIALDRQRKADSPVRKAPPKPRKQPPPSKMCPLCKAKQPAEYRPLVSMTRSKP